MKFLFAALALFIATNSAQAQRSNSPSDAQVAEIRRIGGMICMNTGNEQAFREAWDHTSPDVRYYLGTEGTIGVLVYCAFRERSEWRLSALQRAGLLDMRRGHSVLTSFNAPQLCDPVSAAAFVLLYPNSREEIRELISTMIDHGPYDRGNPTRRLPQLTQSCRDSFAATENTETALNALRDTEFERFISTAAQLRLPRVK